MFKSTAAVALAISFGASAANAETPAKRPCEGAVGYAVETLDLGKGKQQVRFSPMPEMVLTCQLGQGVFVDTRLDIKQLNGGHGLQRLDEAGIGLNQLLLGYASGPWTLRAGKFDFLPTTGYAALFGFPNGRPVAGSEETAFAYLAITGHTGVALEYSGQAGNGLTIDAKAAVSTYLPSANDLWFQSFRPAKDGLGDGGAAISGRLAFTQAFGDAVKFTLGTEGSLIPGGATSTADQSMIGLFASTKIDLGRDITASLAGQWARIQGLGGVNGRDINGVFLYGDLSGPINKSLGLGWHIVSSSNWINGINDSHLGAGLTWDIKVGDGKTLKLFGEAGPDWYDDSKAKGWSMNAGARLRF